MRAEAQGTCCQVVEVLNCSLYFRYVCITRFSIVSLTTPKPS